jgi:queuine tRNA-ribosyltransferase
MARPGHEPRGGSYAQGDRGRARPGRGRGHASGGGTAGGGRTIVRSPVAPGRTLRATQGRDLVLFDIGMGAGSNALAARAESERAPEGAPGWNWSASNAIWAPSHWRWPSRSTSPWKVKAGRRPERCLPMENMRRRGQAGAFSTATCGKPWPAKLVLADIVFWDPFSPKVNPDLWTVAAFAAIRRVANARCTLYTYSASTAVRCALLLAGWAVGMGESIGEKASTTAAAVAVTDLAQPLDRSWLARLSRRDVPLPSDAPADFIARISAMPQFGR